MSRRSCSTRAHLEERVLARLMRLVICDAAKAASDCEPLPEYEEIRFHTSDMRQPRLRRRDPTAAPQTHLRRHFVDLRLAHVLLCARGNSEISANLARICSAKTSLTD